MSEVLTSKDTETFCDSIKLNEFNQIQAHGCLLVLDKKLRVIQYSENVTTFLGTTIEALLNSPVSAFMGSENLNENIDEWLIKKSDKYKRVDWVSPKNKIKIWVRAHQADEGIILEIEPLIENTIEDNTLFDLMQHVVDDMQLLAASQNMQELIQKICDEIQKITGYDHVMVYQFNEHDHSGVVVGEALNENIKSYLGLHFPATDIPENVRAMYLKMPIRYIPTINYKLERIVPEINPVTNTYVDLSATTLRMVAPVHIKYLKNMGVESAMSIAIIQNNKLWGLIACHHNKPKYLSVDLRLILMLIGNTLGIQVASLDYSKEFQIEQRAAELLSTLTENIYKEDSLLNSLDTYHREMMELVGATGMSIYFQNNLLSYGESPTEEQVMTLIGWIKSQPAQASFATSSLPVLVEESLAYKDKASGLLAIPLTRLKNHYIMFYRPERIHSVFWAGNPSGSLKYDANNEYSPRDSFERFMQTITNQAVPWTTHDIKAAEFIRSIVINKQLQDLLQVQAMQDPLTGLLNRLYLDQRLEIELNRAQRKSQSLVVILTDVDFFKKFNDNYGHQAGDYVLSEFAKFLRNSFRGYDYIYRYGGEEFLIVLPDTTTEDAKIKAEILRTEIKQLKLECAGIKLPMVTISAGIAVYPGNGIDGRSLIAAADIALYNAKSTGRDKVVSAPTH